MTCSRFVDDDILREFKLSSNTWLVSVLELVRRPKSPSSSPMDLCVGSAMNLLKLKWHQSKSVLVFSAGLHLRSISMHVSFRYMLNLMRVKTCFEYAFLSPKKYRVKFLFLVSRPNRSEFFSHWFVFEHRAILMWGGRYMARVCS